MIIMRTNEREQLANDELREERTSESNEDAREIERE